MTSFHALRRLLASGLGDASAMQTPRPLETSERGAWDAPSVRPAEVLEGSRFAAHGVAGDATTKFDAFLDGTQLALVAWWVGGIPIVHGAVGAAIRIRRDRRLTTWQTPIVRRAAYAPKALVPKKVARVLSAADVPLVDTMSERDRDTSHPFGLQDLAYRAVQRDRERAERELAARWAASERGMLYVDGGIAPESGSAIASSVVGVVKSHQHLYLPVDGIDVVLGLRPGERSSVVRVDGQSRASVASWYLRSRDSAGHDPFWGLVRVEVSLDADATPAALTKRADDVSRWILAERLPLSVPDLRWDRMAYGIRDTEEYLRAVR